MSKSYVTLLDAELMIDPAAWQSGQDESGRYHGGAYWYAQHVTDEAEVHFSEAIASWQANVPEGAWLEVELRAQVDGRWSKWYSMGVWLEAESLFQRHSVKGQGDEDGTVYTDSLVMKKEASALQARITLCTIDRAVTPTVRGLGVTLSGAQDEAGRVPFSGVASDLNVPKRSQMVFPNGGNVWCSPTCVSMVMAYWAELTGRPQLDVPVPEAKDKVWDHVYQGAGNWIFNTAYASSFGLQAKVVRMQSLADVERWTAAGVPVVASIAYKEGELGGSPLPKVAGHLVVVRGFDAEGNVLSNDPAFPSDAEVSTVYDRLQFERCWLGNSNGAVYLIHPPAWNVPQG